MTPVSHGVTKSHSLHPLSMLVARVVLPLGPWCPLGQRCYHGSWLGPWPYWSQGLCWCLWLLIPSKALSAGARGLGLQLYPCWYPRASLPHESCQFKWPAQPHGARPRLLLWVMSESAAQQQSESSLMSMACVTTVIESMCVEIWGPC